MIDHEMALIGALITKPDKIAEVIGVLRPEDIENETARACYVAAVSLWRRRLPVDGISVSSEIGGEALFIGRAISEALSHGHAHHARLIADAARERRVIADLERILAMQARPTERLGEMYAVYQREIGTDERPADIVSVVGRFDKLVSENKNKQSIGWPTGISHLEDRYIQYQPGHIWTLGAFTSVGKTAMAVQMICNLVMLEPSPTIVLISTEMTEEQVISRILANFTGVHSVRILSGKYWPGEEEVVEQYRKYLLMKQLFIYDSIYDVAEIEAVCARLSLQGGVDLVFIDYVQNCRLKGATSEYQEQANIAKRFQKLAKDCRATLVCLSQVSNDVARGNTDNLELKGAGEWAAVSDVGIMLQRSKGEKYKLKLMVKKNRHGALVTFGCEYKNDFTRIETTQVIE